MIGAGCHTVGWVLVGGAVFFTLMWIAIDVGMRRWR